MKQVRKAKGQKYKKILDDPKKTSKKPRTSSPDDSTVADVVAMALRMAEILQMAGGRKVTLSIPDANTEKEFIEEAKQVYREAHAKRERPRHGRRPVDIECFNTIVRLCSETGNYQPTQGEMVRTLMERNGVTKNTAEKYAKLFNLSFRIVGDESRLTDAEQRWLIKQLGPDWRDKTFLRRVFSEK